MSLGGTSVCPHKLFEDSNICKDLFDVIVPGLIFTKFILSAFG